MAKATEIAPSIHLVSIYAERGNPQFNHFVVKDDEPLLFHADVRETHSDIRRASFT